MSAVLTLPRAGQPLRFNYRIALSGLLFTVGVWVVFVAAACLYGYLWRGHPILTLHGFAETDGGLVEKTWRVADPQSAPHWPTTLVALENFATLLLFVEFALTKAWAMVRRQQWMRRDIDWLTVSLVLPNVLLAVLFLYAAAVVLFPELEAAREWQRRLIRTPLDVAMLFGTVMLCLVPDQPPPDQEGETA